MYAFPLFFFLPIFKSLDHVVCYGFAAFGIYCRPDCPKADQALEKSKHFLQTHNIDIITLEDILNGYPAEAVLAFGGDGSLLHAARYT